MGGVEELASLPSCAQGCMQKSCGALLDLACVCKDAALNGLKYCLGSCSVSEAIVARKYTNLACDVPIRTKGHELNTLVFTMGPIAMVCVIARVLFKQFLSAKKRLDNDDWTILTAIPTGCAIIAVVSAGLDRNGLGTDIWGLSNAEIYNFGVFALVGSVMYIVLLSQVKVSLCFFYLNIFQGDKMRRLLWVTVFFHMAIGLAFVLVLLLSCSPTDVRWKRFDLDARPLAQGRCLKLNATGWAYAALSVASDVWLIGLPLTQVRRLNMHLKKKIGVVLMFLTGAVVTVISILRLDTMKTYNNTTNPTYDQYSLVWWSTLEISTGFICTSLPSLRLIFIHMAPRVFGTDRAPSWRTEPRSPKPGAKRPTLYSLPTMTMTTRSDCRKLTESSGVRAPSSDFIS